VMASTNGEAARADESEPSRPSVAGWEGVLVFGPDGLLHHWSRGAGVPPGIASLDDLRRQYRQPDGVPIEVSAAGRVVAVPRDPHLSRVLLVVEPLVGSAGESSGQAITVIPFRTEEDPQTLQRALGSVLAHELRTPMTTVYGSAELLGRPGLAEAIRVEAAHAVVLAAGQLHRVIEDLVLLVRWSGDPVDSEPVLVQHAMRTLVDRGMAIEVPVDLEIESDLPPVQGTEAIVVHLLRNMLAHAIANSPPGGRVAIAARRNDAHVELRIRDDGEPLDDGERTRAFELFAPTARQSADPSGANLSLVVARRLVERLGGTIHAGDRPEGGELVVTLPAAVDREADSL